MSGHYKPLTCKEVKQILTNLGFTERPSNNRGGGKTELILQTMKDPDDYWNYYRREYPFIVFEELTNWPNDLCYEVMRSYNRCSQTGIPSF